MEATVQETPPATRALNELRVCRGHMLANAAVLDAAGEGDAHHSLLLSLTSLDDCIDALELEEKLATKVIPIRGDTIADDRRDDLMMDAEGSHGV